MDRKGGLCSHTSIVWPAFGVAAVKVQVDDKAVPRLRTRYGLRAPGVNAVIDAIDGRCAGASAITQALQGQVALCAIKPCSALVVNREVGNGTDYFFSSAPMLVRRNT